MPKRIIFIKNCKNFLALGALPPDPLASIGYGALSGGFTPKPPII